MDGTLLYQVNLKETEDSLEQKIILNSEIKELPEEARKEIAEAITNCTIEVQKIIQRCI